MCNFTRLMINFRHLATTTKITKIQQNHQIGVDHIIWSFSVTCHHVGLYRRLTSKTKITRNKTAPSFGPFFQQIGMHSISESNKKFNVQNSAAGCRNLFFVEIFWIWCRPPRTDFAHLPPVRRLWFRFRNQIKRASRVHNELFSSATYARTTSFCLHMKVAVEFLRFFGVAVEFF